MLEKSPEAAESELTIHPSEAARERHESSTSSDYSDEELEDVGDAVKADAADNSENEDNAAPSTTLERPVERSRHHSLPNRLQSNTAGNSRVQVKIKESVKSVGPGPTAGMPEQRNRLIKANGSFRDAR